jgi:hypothetical protein
MRSQLRTASLSNLPKLVVQRKVDTSGGEWDTDKYDLVTPATPSGFRGADIKLKFKPGNLVDAELIGLVQTSKAIGNGKVSFIGDKTRERRGISSKDAITSDPVTKETDEGTHIDQAAHNINPLYAVEGAPSTDKNLDDTLPVAGDVTKSNTWGRHGFHFTDSKGKPQHQDAILEDRPVQPNVEKDSSNTFEVTALALKGTQAGTYYGSVRWGWRTDSKGSFTKFPLEKVSDGVPSSTFMKAGELWNASKTSTGADTLDLPIVDVKVTTAPITGVYPEGFIGPPLQVPTGTRIQIIRNATPPSTNGQIRVVDGVFTGNTLEVTPTDMANIRDERS